MHAQANLDAILKHPAIWRIGQMPVSLKDCIPTGHAALDSVLASRGWSQGEMTEILTNEQGIGELLLLVPALRQLTQAGRSVVLVAPPYLPFPVALESMGIRLDRLVLIHADGQERLWATEQAARSGACGMVITWGNGSRKEWSYPSLRRLQVAANNGNSALMVYRPAPAIHDASPAPTRLVVSALAGELQVRIAKRRGALLAETICLNLHTPHWQSRTARDVQAVHDHAHRHAPAGKTPIAVLATSPRHSRTR